MKTWNQKPLLTIWIVKRTTVTEWLHLKPVQPSGGAILSLHPWFGKPGPKTISHSPFITFPSPRPILLRFLWLQPRTLVVLTVRLDLSWSKAKVKLRFRMTKILTWFESKKGANLCSVSLEPRNWLMVSNIPFGSYQPEWTDYLKTYSSIFGWNFRKVTLPFTFHPEFPKFSVKW